LDGTSFDLIAVIPGLYSPGAGQSSTRFVVGSGTVFADDPQPTARDVEGGLLAHQPLRGARSARHRFRAAHQALARAAETCFLDTAVPPFA